MGHAPSPGARQQVRAVAVVSRLSATLGYNLVAVLLGVGLGVQVGGTPRAATLWAAAGYALATMLAKFQASVADGIHDRDVDAVNPEKNVIAAAVATLGKRRTWLLFGGYLLASIALYAVVAAVAGGWLLAAGIAVIALGFTYSFPPRFKERGIWNHVVTTGVDTGLFILPLAVLVGGRLAPAAVVAVGVVACYSFGYHVLHQAADVYFDRQAGVETFATDIGVATAVAVAAAATAASAGLAVAVGYPLAAVGLGGVTVFYVDLFTMVEGRDERSATLGLADRFSIAWVATLSNGVLAASIWRQVLGGALVQLL